MVNDSVKKCSKCGQIKPLLEYYRRKDSKDGFEGRCKKCANKDKFDPAKRRAITKKYYHAHKELAQARCKAWKEKNREKHLAQQRQWHKEHPAPHRTFEQYRSYQLKSYGLSLYDFEHIYQIQNGKCAICQEKSDKILCVDHDHSTGKIRGLLCRHCNTALGLIKDNSVIAQKMFEYLIKTTELGLLS